MIVLSCGQDPATVASVNVMVGVRSQSVAVAEPVLPGKVLAVHSTVMFPGQTIAGGVVSTIIITCRHVDEFPQSSVALQVRLSVNALGHDPDTVASLIVIVGVASQLSVAIAG